MNQGLIMAYWGIWHRGRNTPIVVEAKTRSEAISKSKKSNKAGHDQPVESARQLTGKALEKARKGEWVRIRKSQGMNEAPDTSKGSYRYRPQLKKKAQN